MWAPNDGPKTPLHRAFQTELPKLSISTLTAHIMLLYAISALGTEDSYIKFTACAYGSSERLAALEGGRHVGREALWGGNTSNI